MKKVKKASYESMLEIFDTTHRACSWEGIKAWREALEKNGWTDEEFDEELNKRIMDKSA